MAGCSDCLKLDMATLVDPLAVDEWPEWPELGREETVRFRCSSGSKQTFGIQIYSRLEALGQLGLPLHGLSSDWHGKIDGYQTPAEAIRLEVIAIA